MLAILWQGSYVFGGNVLVRVLTQQTVSSHLMLSRMQVFTFSWEKESIGSQMEVYEGLAVYIW